MSAKTKFENVKIIETFRGGAEMTESNMLFYPTPDMEAVEEFEDALIRSKTPYTLVYFETVMQSTRVDAMTHNGKDPKSAEYKDNVECRFVKGYSIFVKIKEFVKESSGDYSLEVHDDFEEAFAI